MKDQLKRYKVVQFGLGRIGAQGFDELPAGLTRETHLGHLTNDPRFELVGIWDTDYEKMETVIKTGQLSALDLSEMSKINADVAVIATPEDSHLKVIQEVLKMESVKLVICEKPFCSNSAEAKQALSMLQSKKVSCLVNYPRSLGLEKTKFFSKLNQVLSAGEELFVQTLFVDEGQSSIWHFFNLLLHLHPQLCKLSVSLNEINSSIDFTNIELSYNSIFIDVFLVKKRMIPIAEARFLTKDSIYWLLDGFSRVHRNNREAFYGWKSFPENSIPESNLLENPMKKLYDKGSDVLDCTLTQIQDVEQAILTHQLIEKIKMKSKNVTI